MKVIRPLKEKKRKKIFKSWYRLVKCFENNEERTCYFHNWGGDDCILSLPYLLNLDPNLTFKPVVKDEQIQNLGRRTKITAHIPPRNSYVPQKHAASIPLRLSKTRASRNS